MSSNFERVLIYDKSVEGRICSTLCDYLDDNTSLYRMRSTSNTLRDTVDLDGERLWGVLYMHAPLLGSQEKIFNLERISPYCHTLTIKVKVRQIPPQLIHETTPLTTDGSQKSISGTIIDEPEPPPPQDLAAYEVDRNIWAYVFKRFQNLQNLTLVVDGDPAWPGRGEVESALTCLRCSMERAALKNLRSLTLSPIHHCGILHLRWAGFGAFYEVPTSKVCAGLWQSITLLEIRLRSPALGDKQLTEAQTRMSIKILQDYLRSFSPNLRCLRFVWLDGEGPSQLLLDDEPGMESLQRLFWPSLIEVHLGNITTMNKTIQAIPDRAPSVRAVKALRSTHRFSRSDPSDQEAWVDVDIEEVYDRRRQGADSRASSFYSQDGQ